MNRHSPEWAELKRRNLNLIETHRQELEGLTVAPDRAHQLRGMIFALREQIEAIETKPPTVKDINYG